MYLLASHANQTKSVIENRNTLEINYINSELLLKKKIDESPEVKNILNNSNLCELENRFDEAKSILDISDGIIESELERWNVKRQEDALKTLQDMAKSFIDYHEKSLQLWRDAMECLQPQDVVSTTSSIYD
ncbi:hypothetical protein Ciccas_006628 [Cichlidogyrus casuarinus]|uniref:Uncharacterized protein n=1 Tax=Cichlidogyrus casuarinus TaxID=1844966 RepID=A0ABD2Q582_9PLAT